MGYIILNMAAQTTMISTVEELTEGASHRLAGPGFLVAWAPDNAVVTDRFLISSEMTMGRSSRADVQLRHPKVSKIHVRLVRTPDGVFIDDQGSTNGTFVDGTCVRGPTRLSEEAVIRIGGVLFVFHGNAQPFIEPAIRTDVEMAGRFHVGPLVTQLREATLSPRHVLLAGPTGSGKELAARMIGELIGEEPSKTPLVVHNAACFAGEQEATSSLFGVGARVFSGVDARSGLIEEARGGVLFLDEAHSLPVRVQRSLLRVMEDGVSKRIGETKSREVKLRFVLASNEPPPDYGLIPDLVPRLRVVEIPALSERRADIPSIFERLVEASSARAGLNPGPVLASMNAEHYESMCLDGFPTDNVRGLLDLADRIVVKAAAGVDPARIIDEVLGERLSRLTESIPSAPMVSPDRHKTSASSAYILHKDEIIATYERHGRNMAATERVLHDRGIRTSRRWLGIYLKRWGVK